MKLPRNMLPILTFIGGVLTTLLIQTMFDAFHTLPQYSSQITELKEFETDTKTTLRDIDAKLGDIPNKLDSLRREIKTDIGSAIEQNQKITEAQLKLILERLNRGNQK